MDNDTFNFEQVKKDAEKVAKEAEKKYIQDKRMEHVADISKDLKPISPTDFSNPTKEQKDKLEKLEEKHGKIVVKNGKDKEEKDSPIVEATDYVMHRYNFLTIEESKEILYYKNGVYVTGGEIIIEKAVERLLGDNISNAQLAEIKGHVMRRTYHKREELDTDINIINLENGLYKIEENILLPHTPEYLSIKQKPITYIKDAKPKLLGKFLSEVVYPKHVRTAVDIIAYTFHRDYIIEAIFKLYGHGANGKTVFTGIITKLHGDKNVSNVSLQDMLNDSFALSDLEGKDVNIDNELGSQTIKETSQLKKLTAGSRNRIRIQRKNQKAYDTILHAKLFFNVNKMPDSTDESDAYNRRIYILTFPNRFEGKDEDTQIGKKLTTKEELSGIFNVCMIALRKIQKTNAIFLTEKTIDERREKYERAVNPIMSFFRDAVLPESLADRYITKLDFYNVYVKYCEKYTLPPEKYIQFCKKVKSMHTYDGREEKNGEKISYWKGITLIPEYDPNSLQTTFS